jgi:hypothetical protein
MSGLSLGTLVLAVLLMPVMVARMPADYFVRKEPPPGSWRDRHPAIRWSLRIAKSVLGALLVLVGIPLVPLPGQGFVTILAGLALLEFPGKRRLELAAVRVPGVLTAVNWMRSRARKPPLLVPDRMEERRPGP